ncbi:hypothetical protein BGP_5221 [Beggiatoa sp. PS]|nr:hypothetical protein BGP_5221 [Beggiatoa sp. PS]
MLFLQEIVFFLEKLKYFYLPTYTPNVQKFGFWLILRNEGNHKELPLQTVI